MFDLPEFSKSGERDKAILDHIRSGDFEINWGIIQTECNGHTGLFYVFADALKIGGIRINVSAKLEQQIADILGCLLMTPKLSDLCWQQAKIRLVPSPQQITSSTKAMQAHSGRIDSQISKLGIVPVPGQIIRTIGKDWVLSNQLAAKGSSRAENYGWHFEGKQFGGQKWEPAVTGGRVIQGEGWAHDPTHVDYSQICCLVHRQCLIDNKPMDLMIVYQDSDLSCLISHEGALKITRQPGVEPFTNFGFGAEYAELDKFEPHGGRHWREYDHSDIPHKSLTGWGAGPAMFGGTISAGLQAEIDAERKRRLAMQEHPAKVQATVHESPNTPVHESPHSATTQAPHLGPGVFHFPHSPIIKRSKIGIGRHVGKVPPLLGSKQFKPEHPVQHVSLGIKERAKDHAGLGVGIAIGIFVGGPLGALIGGGLGAGFDYMRKHGGLPKFKHPDIHSHK